MNTTSPNPDPSQPDLSRRTFLKHSSLAVASGVAAMSFPSILHAETKPPINAIIIGLGGGAGKNFLDASKTSGIEGKIVAVADVFPDAAKTGTKNFDVPEDKCFSGFDAYKKALEVPGVNYAIIATPPGFKPTIFKAC